MSSDNDMGSNFWAGSLEDVDREVARLAAMCNLRILDPGVIERVLQNDATVCGTKNPPAFAKLRNALTMHYHLREQAVGQLGEAKTQQLIAAIVERLRSRVGDRLGGAAPTN